MDALRSKTLSDSFWAKWDQLAVSYTESVPEFLRKGVEIELETLSSVNSDLECSIFDALVDPSGLFTMRAIQVFGSLAFAHRFCPFSTFPRDG